MFPEDLKYTEEHQWISVEKDVATIGITSQVFEEIGEVIFVDLPEVGGTFEQMDEYAGIEAKNGVLDLCLPVGGEIIKVNQELLDDPDLVNTSPYEDGWLVKVKIVDEKEVDDLMNVLGYENFIESM